jgi:hypothetical protein
VNPTRDPVRGIGAGGPARARPKVVVDPDDTSLPPVVRRALPVRSRTVDGALRFLRTKRRRAEPNRGFRRQLKALEKRRAFDDMLRTPLP